MVANVKIRRFAGFVVLAGLPLCFSFSFFNLQSTAFVRPTNISQLSYRNLDSLSINAIAKYVPDFT
jgi:hypothetical protein